MIKKLTFFFNFLNCVYIFEKKILNKRIQYLEFFLKKINFFKFILFLFNRNKFNPIKSQNFGNFIILNNKKWIADK